MAPFRNLYNYKLNGITISLMETLLNRIWQIVCEWFNTKNSYTEVPDLKMGCLGYYACILCNLKLHVYTR